MVFRLTSIPSRPNCRCRASGPGGGACGGNGNWSTEILRYDAYGNVIEEKKMGGSASPDSRMKIVYDGNFGHFPLGRKMYNSEQAEYETIESVAYFGVASGPALSDPYAFFGAPAAQCGMNEICTHFGYDRFGRPTRRWDRVPTDVARSNNTDANCQIHWMYHAPGELAGLDTYMMTEWQNPRAEGNFVRKHYNGLGQLVLEQTPYANWSSGGGDEIHVNYAYDGLGRQIHASTPRLRGQGIWSTAVAWDSVPTRGRSR